MEDEARSMDITYAPGALTAGELRRAVLVAIDTLFATSPEFAAAALDDGVQAEVLRSSITIRPTEAGIDGATVALVVAFAPSLNHVVRTLWDRFVLPRVRLDAGDDAVGETVSSEADRPTDE